MRSGSKVELHSIRMVFFRQAWECQWETTTEMGYWTF